MDNREIGMKFTVKVGNKSKTFKSLQAAAKAFKIPYQTLYQRLFVMEWSPKKAVTTKVRIKRKAKRKARSKK